ncbi:WD40/YVTN repeat-like-containing domain [Phaffia rhodozyma]|uniref:WD40/YVTN repeat-like-containing domain n=1 Tax=Phaffia rhodozyma TaxID=264483 RepID=A0A0F7SMG3_PHARH|nr:WD40/YVTN repeat-like-containing domain [Phaffia rhodozyma]
MSSTILLGSYTDSIHTVYFQPPSAPGVRDGKLTVGDSHKVMNSPSWVARHPTFDDLVYTVGEEDGKVAVIRVSADGKTFNVEATASTQGEGPAHCDIVANGAALAVANYLGSSVLLIPLLPTGLFSPEEDHTVVKLPFNPTDSPLRDLDRQEKPHPHQVVSVVVDGEFEVWSPDLGSDKVWRFKITTVDGKMGFKLKEDESLTGDEGGGPRHILVSSDAKQLYVLNELRPALLHYEIDSDTSAPVLKSNTSVLPPTLVGSIASDVPVLAAELLLVPTKQNKTIVASTRMITGRDVDALALFNLNEQSGEVSFTTHLFPRKGREFRGVGLSKDGQYIVASGQTDGWISVFGQDPSGEWVEVVEEQVQVEKPTGVLFI